MKIGQIKIMGSRESWYRLVNGDDLEQGDILLNIPIVELPVDFPWPQREDTERQQTSLVHSIDGIVISQSCDLQQPGKLEFVAFCPIWLLDEIPEFAGKGKRESLRQGRMVAYHLLDMSSVKGLEHGFVVVEFKRIFSLPIQLTKRLAKEQGDRLRLVSPYKEHLSQSFARFFMRVGLPSDIPKFE